jgi:hypothetical protein
MAKVAETVTSLSLERASTKVDAKQGLTVVEGGRALTGVAPTTGLLCSWSLEARRQPSSDDKLNTPWQPPPLEAVVEEIEDDRVDVAARPPMANLTKADQATAAVLDERLLGGTQLDGAMVMRAARTHGVEPEFLLAQLQIETGILGEKPGRSIKRNNPGNLRWADWELVYGGVRAPRKGFTSFTTLEDGLHAMAHRVSRSGKLSGFGSLERYVKKYAPASDGNNVRAYVKMLRQLIETYGRIVNG